MTEDPNFAEIREKLRGAKLALVGTLLPPRIGVRAFTILCEYRLFPPFTDANKYFYMNIVQWEHATWGVVIVPSRFTADIDNLLGEVMLRRADGVPHVLRLDADMDRPGALVSCRKGHPVESHFKTITCFPVDADNLFTLEYTRGAMHMDYHNDVAKRASVLAAEETQCLGIIKAYHDLHGGEPIYPFPLLGATEWPTVFARADILSGDATAG